jgi:TPR repeat protein
MRGSTTGRWVGAMWMALGAAAVGACDVETPPPSSPPLAPMQVTFYGLAPATALRGDDGRQARGDLMPPSNEAADCKAGRSDACRSFGERICREGSVLECRAACDADNGVACDRLADIYERGTRVPSDPVTAARMRQRACDDGLGPACARCADEGACLADTSQVSRDLARACGGCPFTAAGLMSEDQRAECRACDTLAKVDASAASADFERACTAVRLAADPSEDPRDFSAYGACARLARLDPPRAASILEAACEDGALNACSYVAASGHARSQEARLNAMRQLCSGRPHSDACGRLRDLGAGERR